ncbi:hypothetical protein FQA39_LY06567 [Lamprigera yunnana]|nr:hypothetical protein FQA39_LY06567 [Lamprigera yunnana]
MSNSNLRYEKIEFLGEGQFATVYKAKDKENDNIVAVKKIKASSKIEAQDGINRTALREIKILQELNHKNCLVLLDVFSQGSMSNVSLVFDFMDTDLEVIIKDNMIILTTANIKSYMIQTLQGLEYLHLNWILHRDLKPNNLLLYGSPNRINTHQVVTRWYRSPELLFGAKQYSVGVDMWAVGCILAELMLRLPFLPGESDLDQLTKIFQVFGNPTEQNWPGAKTLSDYVEFKPYPPMSLKNIFIAAGDDLLDVAEALLVLNPLKRKTCTETLQMPYFTNKPAPTISNKLPLPQNIKKLKDLEKPSLKRKLLNSAEGGTLSKRLFF